MKLVRRVILFISLSVIIISLTSRSELPEFSPMQEEEKNFFTGLKGENNQILVVKIDDTNAAHPQIGVESADVVYVEQVEAGLTRLAAV